ncbi:MAG: hypothetical protein JNK45_10795 [Myxococcales bacterium]|nr:hypothetical protein [Myxococcales bacterium]
MARRLALTLVPFVVVVACGDDVTESADTSAGTDGTQTSTSFTSIDDTFDVSSDPSSVTFTTDGPTSVTTFDTSDSDVTTVTTVSTTTSDESSTDPTTVSTSSDATTSDATTSDGTSTSPTTDATTSDGTTTEVSTTTDATTSDGTTEGTTTDTGGGGFPDAPVFGSNVLDLDLVGVWGLNWDPASGFDSVLDIDDMGNFTWTESSADCSAQTVASGFLWVSGSQVVMHVETWDRPLPWDTEPVLGETFAPPFRLRMSFSLQGSGPDDYLALAAPSRVTEAAPYAGESYIRLTTDGAFLGGTWRGEAELEAIPAGEVDPVVIVRDVYQAILDPEAALDPEGTGIRATNTTYFPVPSATDTFDGGNWTCLGGCPQPSGTTLVDGSNLYTYGPYGGNTHLLTFASGRTFRSGFDSDCP